jgi:hypothetical protein
MDDSRAQMVLAWDAAGQRWQLTVAGGWEANFLGVEGIGSGGNRRAVAVEGARYLPMYWKISTCEEHMQGLEKVTGSESTMNH